MVHVLLPFMVFPLLAVMNRIDPNILRVARSLGAVPRRAFRHVFLPLSLPGIAAGCVLVFLLAVGFYITPALLGGPGQITLATMIDMEINTFLNWGFAAESRGAAAARDWRHLRRVQRAARPGPADRRGIGRCERCSGCCVRYC